MRDAMYCLQHMPSRRRAAQVVRKLELDLKLVLAAGEHLTRQGERPHTTEEVLHGKGRQCKTVKLHVTPGMSNRSRPLSACRDADQEQGL